MGKQFALVYVGKYSLADLDAIGVKEFNVHYKILESQIKEERTQRKRAKMVHDAKMKAQNSRNRFTARR